MLPFGLKVVWFCLSLSGLLSCWATLLAFGHAMGVYWPLVYCIGCTLVQGVFCLGMIWRMNPFNMPNSFCIIQPILIGFGAFIMTGVAGAFSMATSLAVLKPKNWGDNGRSALIWRRLYFFPIFVFPVIASAVQIGITFGHHSSFFPNDDMHCDYFAPIWIRFLSYAGVPFLISIPCLYLSIKSVIRIIKTNKHLERSRNPDMDIDHFTALPRRPKEVQVPRVISTPSPSYFTPIVRREPLSPAIAGTSSASRRFHMPFVPPINLNNLNSSKSASQESDEQDSPVSASFPTFVNPPQGGTTSIDPDGISEIELRSRPKEDWREILEGTHSPEMDKRNSLKWDEDRKSDFDYMKEGDDYDNITEDSEIYSHTPQMTSRSLGNISRRSRRPPPPTLSPTVWRIILFQLSFILIQVLACISTLIDVGKQRPPASFGTQHVALLLSAWAPVVIFAHVPIGRNTFVFWRPWR